MAFKSSEYHPDWRDVIRPAILKRAGFKCEGCGLRQRARGFRDSNGIFHECDSFREQWEKERGRRIFTIFLSIAHLDHNPDNNDYSNLRAYCQKCHNGHDKQHRRMSRMLQRASILLLLLSFSLLACNAQPKATKWKHIKNFHSAEFDCTCGAPGRDRMDLKFVRKIDIARDLAGVPFIITSAYRTEKYNAMIGGVLKSSHIKGLAVDIYCTEPSDRFAILNALFTVGFNRIGIYPSHIHVDDDESKMLYVLW